MQYWCPYILFDNAQVTDENNKLVYVGDFLIQLLV